MSHHFFDRSWHPATDRCPKPVNSADMSGCARVGHSEPFFGVAAPSIQRTDSKPARPSDSADARAHCRNEPKRSGVLRPENEAMTVAQLSRRSGVESHVVRYYSRQGLLTPLRHPDNQYRLYCSAHVARLRFIQQAKALGFSLSEIRRFLQDAEGGRSPCPRVRALIASRIEANRRKIDDLIALQNRMEDALRRWETLPDHAPENDSVCHLIESYGAMRASPATNTHGA